MNIKDLEKKAKMVRRAVIEKAYGAGKAHIGGTLSAVDILVALYYGRFLKCSSQKPEHPNRDRFILSKGHACLALYAIFKDLKVISKKMYDSYAKNGGLGGQLDTRIPGVDFNTGSLGHAIGIGVGMVLAARFNNKHYTVYALVGDSELYEGSMWEAIIFAYERKIKNLVVLIDRNRLSVIDVIEKDEGPYHCFGAKMESFGWHVEETDGHNFKAMLQTLEKIKKIQKPVMVVLNTIKGKGVSFMENDPRWHHGGLSKEQYEKAKQELS